MIQASTQLDSILHVLRKVVRGGLFHGKIPFIMSDLDIPQSSTLSWSYSCEFRNFIIATWPCSYG